MLQSENRLRKRRDIDRVYRRGTYGSGEGYISLKAAKGVALQSRAVVVVSKKVDKRAVIRNRIRRRLLAALLNQWATVPSGYDIVISVHRDTSELESTRLQELVSGALRRANISSSK
jgi:ribonuclease P protein component